MRTRPHRTRHAPHASSCRRSQWQHSELALTTVPGAPSIAAQHADHGAGAHAHSRAHPGRRSSHPSRCRGRHTTRKMRVNSSPSDSRAPHQSSQPQRLRSAFFSCSSRNFLILQFIFTELLMVPSLLSVAARHCTQHSLSPRRTRSEASSSIAPGRGQNVSGFTPPHTPLASSRLLAEAVCQLPKRAEPRYVYICFWLVAACSHC